MSEGKNGESGPQEEQTKEPKLNKEQYELLLGCSKSGDVKPWNKYRKEHPDDEIWLQGADLMEANLQGANLWKANLQDADLTDANLQGADLGYANLQSADLWGVNLQGVDLRYA
ncbi:MAG: pentapeptide repeat-containing protein, partial [Phycisphaerae bacterium]